MQLSIRVDGVLVRKGLQDLTAEIPKIGRRQIYDAMNRITRKMEAYPPERPLQKYVRTGRLGFSWWVKRLDDGYTISNDVRSIRTGKPYAVYVVGDAYGTRQAWMHVGRWLVFRDVVDVEMERLPGGVAKQIVMVARRKGFEAQEVPG